MSQEVANELQHGAAVVADSVLDLSLQVHDGGHKGFAVDACLANSQDGLICIKRVGADGALGKRIGEAQSFEFIQRYATIEQHLDRIDQVVVVGAITIDTASAQSSRC